MDCDLPLPCRSFEPLTRREREILLLLAADLSDREIAERLVVSYTTVKWFNRQIFNKLGVENRQQAVERARVFGLVEQAKAERAPARNLPYQATPFIGRAEELAQIAMLLADPTCRLLTLIGVGGIGKTRLAIEAARELPFPAVYFVALQPLNSGDSLVSSIADALGFQFFSTRDLKQQLLDSLREKHWLLVLDNFEHLLEEVSLLTNILRAAPDVKLVVTSRERLNVQEEWLFVLEGLPFPDDQATEPLDSYGAIQLFVQRARQVQAHFALEENTASVRTICQRVEGMPLGLELAATWLRVMSCSQIAAQMEHNVDFLTTRLRNIPERHRSLRAVFEQSWNLLTAGERDGLMALSVFRGGFSLEAAEEVAGTSLAILASLADKSLIRLSASGRYDLHELLRQYASEKLTEAAAANQVADQHIVYFVKLAEQAEAHLWRPDHLAWFNHLQMEWDNLRAALNCSLKNGAAAMGLRLAGALGWFFVERKGTTETEDLLERMLEANKQGPASLRATVLNRLAEIMGIDDEQRLQAYCAEALALAREVNDQANIAWTLSNLGFISHMLLHSDQSVLRLEQSLAIFRQIDDTFGLNHALRRRAWVAVDQHDYVYARVLLEEALTEARKVKNRNASGWALLLLGTTARLHDHNLPEALGHYQSSLAFFREAELPFGALQALTLTAEVEQELGHDLEALAAYAEILPLIERHNGVILEPILVGIARIARMNGWFEQAATLLGVAERGVAHHRSASPMSSSFASEIASVSTQLDHSEFAAALAAGKAMTGIQARAFALQTATGIIRTTPAVTGSAPHGADRFPISENMLIEPLSPRELEVLSLIGSGYSNREIAEHLVVSLNTVRTHLKNLYSKLNVDSRTRAIAKAQEVSLL